MKILEASFFKEKNIVNGWKFELFIDKKKYEVTNQIKKYIKNNILEIEKGFNIKNLVLNKKVNHKICYLRINNKYSNLWKPITIKENTPFKLNLGEIKERKKIEIVYFLNADLSNSFLKLFKDQLNDLIKSGIIKYQNTNLYLSIICSDETKKAQILYLIEKLKIKNICKCEILFSKNKNKEYEGINKVWKLSKINKEEKFIIYFHGKGISYIQNNFFYIRQPLEKLIFNLLIMKWQQNIELISRFKSIDKIGILSGGNGWLWFNFWIAKSTYISQLEKPKKRNRACYYEDWLGRFLIADGNDKEEKYTNEYSETFLDTSHRTMSILFSVNKKKFNLGTTCKVEKGGFVGLGFTKITYRLWYWFYVLLNKISFNKNNEDRFQFF